MAKNFGDATVTFGDSDTTYGGSFSTQQSLTLSLESPSLQFSSTIYPSTISLTLSEETSNINIYSNPGTFAPVLSLLSPSLSLGGSVSPSALELTSSVEDSEIFITKTIDTLSGTLSIEAVIVNIDSTPDAIALALSILAPSIEVDDSYKPSALELALSIETVSISTSHSSRYFTLRLDVKAPSIVPYLDDPVVKSGCPMCGTFLYRRGANQVSKRRIYSEPVRSGRNFDRGEYKDDAYIKCSKCGFVCNTQRDQYSTEGSHLGWGMKYVEERSDA